MDKKYTLTKYACYSTNVCMAAVASISPLLFVTFLDMYQISYTLLGLLVVINYSTQLLVDLALSFFTKFFNIRKTLKLMPVIAFTGFMVYGLMPHFFPDSAYIWICIGTVIFSVSAGLCEVLISPVIAAIPSDNPEAEMSKLHSVYAWGVVFVVVLSTLLLKVIGSQNWMYLALLWSLIPFCGIFLFAFCKLPELSLSNGAEGKGGFLNKGLVLCIACIFLGGASECTMAQWISGFLENAVHIPKVWGDIFGMALFSVFLGLGRTLYSKYGKDISKVMLWGMGIAFVCYVTASIFVNPIVNLVACVLTGFCVSMLWPGTLIYMEEQFPKVGVAAYAIMAAGGDMGASIAPQLVGVVTDAVGVSSFAPELAAFFGISAEQLGMRAGILVSSAFPLMGVLVILYMRKYFRKAKI